MAALKVERLLQMLTSQLPARIQAEKLAAMGGATADPLTAPPHNHAPAR